jgi:hypothetical protein
VSRFAYLVLSHRNPKQIHRLVSAIRTLSPACTIVVSHDQAGSEPPEIDGIGHVISRRPAEWGSFGLVDAVLDGFAAIEGLGPHDWVVVVSGQDFPLVDLDVWEARVASSGANALVLRSASVGHRLRWGRHRNAPSVHLTRYTHRYVRLPNLLPLPEGRFRRRYRKALRRLWSNTAPVLSYQGRPGNAGLLGIRRRAHPPAPAWPPVKGSQWIAFDRRAIEHVIRADRDARIRGPWSKSYIPDEAYFQTLLCNEPTLHVLDRPVSMSLWPDPGLSHPATITTALLPQLLEDARATDAAFGRKFDDAEPGPLEQLEASLLR